MFPARLPIVGKSWQFFDEAGRARNARVHDMLTGTQPDGRAYSDGADHTCRNWTSAKEGSAQVGHHDRNGGGI